ncbi:MAG TPA: hypothetical protein VMJ32_04050 [Pirellulales bacterium]|nr:hypothetical protein [Pirellulales bacterium]
MLNPAVKQRIAELSLAHRLALSALVLAAICLATLPLALTLSGADGLWADGSAAAVVWGASAAGMAIGELLHDSNAAFTKLLIGMIIRMIVPLSACLVALLSKSRLADAGFVFYILVFYLAELPVDTLLAVLRQFGAKPLG